MDASQWLTAHQSFFGSTFASVLNIKNNRVWAATVRQLAAHFLCQPGSMAYLFTPPRLRLVAPYGFQYNTHQVPLHGVKPAGPGSSHEHCADLNAGHTSTHNKDL